MENKAPETRIHKLYKHLVSLKEITKLAKINFFQLFKEYSNYTEFMDIHSLKQITRIDLHISNNEWIVRQMHAAYWYGKIIYSSTLMELEKNWVLAKEKGFDDEYHETYYKLCKKRIKREKVSGKPKNLSDNNKSKKTIVISRRRSLKK